MDHVVSIPTHQAMGGSQGLDAPELTLSRMPVHDSALLLLGHGSTLNADSSAPTYQHAEEIRRRGDFAEVHVGFWKEEPNFRQALLQTTCRTVYVVPNFISSGYFTEQVIPRELGLTGPKTFVEDKTVYYCQPVGLSHAMTEVLLQRAREVATASAEPCDPKQTCLFICGHGTSLNDNSTKIIHEQAEIIRQRGLYADCQAVLMEQRPFVKDWRTLTSSPDVIVVPFFISDGLHSYEDIPVLLGLTHNIRESAFSNPHREGARRLWYASAIGTDSGIADVILDSVAQLEREQGVAVAEKRAVNPAKERHFLSLVSPTPPWIIGQVIIDLAGAGFRLRHKDDLNVADHDLRPLASPVELRELILRDETGAFRPLRSAPNLRRGWVLSIDNGWDVTAALDYFYPAALANLSLLRQGKLSLIPWHETAERQTGRFRIVRELDDNAVHELAAQVCDHGCLKRRLWSPSAQDVRPAPNEVPLLCPEACNYFVSKAREKLKGADSDAE